MATGQAETRVVGSRRSISRMSRLLGFVLLLALLLLPGGRTLNAQSNSYAYWQYDAAGRLNFSVVADIDNDGVDEFLLAVEDNSVVLLNSDGNQRWDYTSNDKVLQVAAIDTGDPESPGAVVIATRNHLTLVDQAGELLWQRQLEAPPGAPPAPVVLLTREDEAAWQSQRSATPVAVAAFDSNGDGQDEIAVALKSGLLLLFNSAGELQWQYPNRDNFPDEALPHLQIADLNRDGRDEIVFSYFLPRRENQGGFSKLALIGGDGQPQWERSVTGRLTAMTLAEFAPDQPLQIAVGTRLGRQSFLYLYDVQGGEYWRRTPNKEITSLAMGQLTGGPGLLVGTEVGTLIAYDAQGRRYWDRAYTFSGQPDRKIAAISATTHRPAPNERQSIVLAVTLAFRDGSDSEATDVLLLDGDGCIVRSTKVAEVLSLGSGCLPNPSIYPAVPAIGLATLVDINHDGRNELLLSRFGTLELVDPGIGVPQYTAATAWGGYRLEARPQAMQVADIDQDGENELLIAGDDGRLHVVRNNGTALWQKHLGGAVSHLQVIESATAGALPTILVIHQNDAAGNLNSQIELLGRDGQLLWEQPLALETVVTGLATGNFDGEGGPEIIVSTTDNEAIVYSLGGVELMRLAVSGRITQLTFLPGTADRAAQIYLGTARRELLRFAYGATQPTATFQFTESIHSVQTIAEKRELGTQLLVILVDGTIYGLNWRGIPLWQDKLDDAPQQVVAAGQIFYIATAAETVTAIDVVANNPYNPAELAAPRTVDLVIDEDKLPPVLAELGQVTSIHRGHLDRDTLFDLAVANRSGKVQLFSGDGRSLGEFQLVTGVFAVTALRSEVLSTDDLLVIADNGVIQLFQARENRPPLLIKPQVRVAEGSYEIEITVIDIENGDVTVALETWNSQEQSWQTHGQRVANSGNGILTWSLKLPESNEPVRYRFSYDDRSHKGVIEPSPGPVPIPMRPAVTRDVALLLAFSLLFAGAAAYISQRRSLASRTRRFSKRLKQQPDHVLSLLEVEYNRTAGSPDFLLSLANQARRNRNRPLAGLADGLFLLADRPEAALPIMSSALSEAQQSLPAWRDLPIWQQIVQTYQSLLEAPSITELSLLRPQLVDLIARQAAVPRPSDATEMLLPILTSLRDSERVELAEDRFVYLHEAAVLVGQLRERLPSVPLSIENQLIQATVSRWLGLVNAAIDELHGQAQLAVNLKTKRLVPEPETTVALEIRNTGRAAAENIVVAVTPGPAYQLVSPSQTILFLPPGRLRQVNFTIAPQVNEHFRLAFQINYDDRHQENHTLAFADMVHLLPPVREFSPVTNPYSPGVPLRRNSPMFYGREELFRFIGETAGRLSQQNVLILVGQRRTGKTSAILRLEEYLPQNLLPVYIDCQSLGVLPGMAALFHDLAWLIADALANRGIAFEVPDPAAWQDDPAGRFQRHFIPAVQALLPDDAILLLLFDEFEAFENLVSDGILPPTLFTYLRHLMQHGSGLSFVFVGTRRLEEMSTDYWSVLFNIALYRQIGFLDHDAALRLINDPVAPNLVYDDLAIDKILRVTAGHPYFLQLVCYTLVNRANRQRTSYVTISDVNAGLEEMLRLGEVHFAYLWQRSSSAERALLTAVAHLMERDTRFHPTDLVQYLAQYGIRLDPAAVTASLNLLVEREIMREVRDGGTTLYELKIALVGLWVAQNKSLSKLHEALNGGQSTTEKVTAPR